MILSVKIVYDLLVLKEYLQNDVSVNYEQLINFIGHIQNNFHKKDRVIIHEAVIVITYILLFNDLTFCFC